jgi:hypothetical protein
MNIYILIQWYHLLPHINLVIMINIEPNTKI